MPIEYIWMVSSDGVPWRIPVLDDPHCPSQVEWEPVAHPISQICSVVSSPASAYAVDNAGNVLMLVYPTHTAIRRRMEIYHNERWYPILKWKRTLSTERHQFSDESGNIAMNPADFQLSDGWSWEEPWSTKVDPRCFDSNGWQYSNAFNGHEWGNKCEKKHFVRRKVLKRHMRYTSYGKWVKLSNENSIVFAEIAVGGFEILNEGEALLFALGNDGEIYRRGEISSYNPNGSSWVKIPKLFSRDSETGFNDISVSSSLGTLLCCTWSGKLFYRKGISRRYPSGLTWLQIETPRDRPVIFMSLGRKSLCCLSADGSLWFVRVDVELRLKEHFLLKIKANDYQELAGNGITKISLTRRDQLVGLSSDRGAILIRTGVCENEVSGKRFEKIIERSDSVNNRFVSVHAGACSFTKIPNYFLNCSTLQSEHAKFRTEFAEFKKAKWRNRILELLDEVNNQAWVEMSNVKIEDLDSEEWVDIKEDQDKKICECQLFIENKYERVNVYTTNKYLSVNFNGTCIVQSDVLFAIPQFQRLPQQYLLCVGLNEPKSILRFAFNDESLRNNFQRVIENIIRCYISQMPRSAKQESMWSVETSGAIRWHCLSIIDSESKELVPLDKSRSLAVVGNFKEIDCGSQQIVWALNSNGCLYSLSTLFEPLACHQNEFEYTLNDTFTYEMYEYQKRAFFRGFATFKGNDNEISAWMCDNCAVPERFSSLPTNEWNWVDNEWYLECEEWEYADDITCPYFSNQQNGSVVRRRLWKREARFELKKSPWCLVESPRMCCVRVAKSDNNGNTVTVVALTTKGEILLRHGVNRDCFTGFNWSQIETDSLISWIEIGRKKLWGVTSDGLLYCKIIDSDEFHNDWSCVDVEGLSRLKKLFLDNLKNRKNIDITCVSNLVYIRIRNFIYEINIERNTISKGLAVKDLRQCIKNSKDVLVLRGQGISYVNNTGSKFKLSENAIDMGKGITCISMF